jgi:hypothetical protein
MGNSIRRERTERNPESLILVNQSRDKTETLAGNRTSNLESLTKMLIHRTSQPTPPSDSTPQRSDRSNHSYILHLVPDSTQGQTIYDILRSQDTIEYTLDEAAVDSLPARGRASLDQQGHVRCLGDYDPSTGRFNEFHVGWDGSAAPDADALLKIIDQLSGNSLAKSVYYFISEYASEQYQNPDVIADVRDVQPSTVKTAIEKAQTSLPDSL